MSYYMDDPMDDRDYDERDGEAPLDPTLAALARDYNAPPTPPREAMWAAIASERGRPAVPVVPITSRRPLRRVFAAAAAIAALLALAFAVGRFSAPGDVPVLAEQTSPDGRSGDGTPSPAPARSEGAPVLAADEPAADDERRETMGDARQADARLAVSERRDVPADESPRRDPPPVAGGPAPGTRLAANASDERPDAFDVAAARHLSRSEVFLTLFRDAFRGEEPADLSPGTARQLLVRNRLLLDSPAAADPRMRRLLEDLELVLVQIAQLPADDREEDTDLINDGLEAGDVLTRLRSATSSDAAATLRQGVL